MSSQNRYDVSLPLSFHEQRKAATLLAEQYSSVLTASPTTFPDRKDVALCNATGGAVAVPLPTGDAETIGLVFAAVKIASDVSGNAVSLVCPAGQTFPGGATSISTTSSGGRVAARWNGLHWQNVSPGSSGGSLPPPGAAGEVLRSNGGAWASSALAQSDVTGLPAALAAKAAIDSPNLTGTPTAPTQAANNNSTRIATTAYADAAVGVEAAARAAADTLLAPLASPSFTGNPTAPSQSTGNSSTRLATTAFVQGEFSARRFRAVFGNNVDTAYTITHNLNSEVIAQVTLLADGSFPAPNIYLQHIDPNTILVTGLSPPGVDSLKINVFA